MNSMYCKNETNGGALVNKDSFQRELITVELTSKPRNKPTQMSTARAPTVCQIISLSFCKLRPRPDCQCPDAGGCKDGDDLSQ